MKTQEFYLRGTDVVPVLNGNESMNKHTQGEWHRGKAYKVRNKWHLPVLSQENKTIVITWPVNENATPEDEANAKLIAAAPDILKALIKARTYLLSDEIEKCGIDEAIIKALQ